MYNNSSEYSLRITNTYKNVYNDITSPYYGLKPRAKYITIKQRKKRSRKNRIKRKSRRKNRC